jgi:ATP-dependent DNA helicase RecG
MLHVAGALGNVEIRTKLRLRDRTHLRERYVDPALADSLVEMTNPDKPNSRLQKCRLTAKGRAAQLFGDRLHPLLEELNETLVA